MGSGVWRRPFPCGKWVSVQHEQLVRVTLCIGRTHCTLHTALFTRHAVRTICRLSPATVHSVARAGENEEELSWPEEQSPAGEQVGAARGDLWSLRPPHSPSQTGGLIVGCSGAPSRSRAAGPARFLSALVCSALDQLTFYSRIRNRAT